MILKKLEISGFKSFGKKVELSFDTPVTAIVGPNGAGKSNVSEAIRWVLGEQSMKSLRGKRGEDLIFHGSGSAAQLGKARVGITFDNATQVFPIDFSEVVISREVYRDGINEYRINDSQVRLKDVVELMSNVGIGGSGHHIISQGEADRLLYASPRDRKNMIEDALGLRIYHIKQQDAERKLASTEENMREVAMLRREIQPHVRFLREEAAKIEASQKMREELAAALRIYLGREHASLGQIQNELREKEEPLNDTLKNAEKEAEELRVTVLKKQSLAEAAVPKDIEEAVKKLVLLEEERPALDRDIGRLEGKLGVLQSQHKEVRKTSLFSAAEAESELRSLLSLLEHTVVMESLRDVLKQLSEMKDRLVRFLTLTTKKEDASEGEHTALQREHNALVQRLTLNEKEQKDLREKQHVWDQTKRDSQAGFWEDQKMLRAAEERIHAAKDGLRSLEIEREHVRMRSDDYERERAEAEPFLGAYAPDAGDVWPEEKRLREQYAIQRLRIKLEEAGGVNPQVLQEYSEVQQRDAFLAKELDDLEKTEKSLQELMTQLEDELQRQFMEGVKKINVEFNQLFQTMFGGGSAELSILRLPQREEDGEESDEEETGVDIIVDIPRKRVKSLDMLSGGERALTSIALLFAMSFVSPPPFLVLDETDAALDEANSQRYGSMLRNLSDKTQLIVITHNRQTMKEAAVLYGVTMGSDGISRLLSLKFEEATKVSGEGHEA